MHLFDFCVVSMSRIQSLVFSGVRDTLNRRVSISHPRMTFRSVSLPSAKCFFIEMMVVLVVASFMCTGRVQASSASGTECVILSLLSPRSAPAWNISSIKLSVTISRGGSCMCSLSAFPISTLSGKYSAGSFRNSKLDRTVDVFHVVSSLRSWATSVIVSLTSLNMDGAGDEPKGNRKRRYARSSIIVMHVTADCVFVWMRR